MIVSALALLTTINFTAPPTYAAQRGSAQAARRELEDLRAAIDHYFADESV